MITVFVDLFWTLILFAGNPLGFLFLLLLVFEFSLPVLCTLSDTYWGTYATHKHTQEQREEIPIHDFRSVSRED